MSVAALGAAIVGVFFLLGMSVPRRGALEREVPPPVPSKAPLLRPCGSGGAP